MKTVVITGSSKGLGEKIVEHFIRENVWNVIGLSRHLPEYASKAHNFWHYPVDISDPKAVAYTFEKIKIQFETIDLLVNNAAVFKMKPFREFTFDEIDNIIDTNLKGSIYCTLSALKLMTKPLHTARIINIGSVSGTHGIKNQAVYSSSKYGLNGFMESLQLEIQEDGILMSNICPGGIDTTLWNENNVYPGDKTGLLQSNDIVSMVSFISKLPDNVVLKTVTMFPASESH